MLKFKSAMALAGALAGACCLAPAAHGQSLNYCVNTSRDRNGAFVLTNDCGVKVHVYWASGNMAWNAYLEPGESHNSENRGSFRIYACEARSFVVDADGDVITREVANFRCKK